MKCSICGGRVEWKGPLSNLTHTQCLKCGGTNCQEVEDTEEEEDSPNFISKPSDFELKFKASLEASIEESGDGKTES